MQRASKRRDYKNILVVRFSSLGDIVLTTPVLDGLRRVLPPDTEISYLLKEEFAPLLKNHPSRCKIIPLSETVRADSTAFMDFVERLKERRFDLIVDLQGNGRSYVVRRRLNMDFLKIKKHTLRRIGVVKFKIGAKRLPNIRDRFFGTLKGIGIRSVEPILPRLGYTEEEVVAARKKFIGKIPDRPLAVVHPGAKWPLKEWGRDRFEKLVESLVIEGFTVAVFDDNISEAPHISKLSGTSIREMIALIASADVFVGNDSGPLHIAESVRTPAVGIFGPTSEALGYSSRWPGSKIVGVDMRCRPCSLYGRGKCRTGGHECMEKLSIEAVLNAVIEQFRWGRSNERNVK